MSSRVSLHRQCSNVCDDDAAAAAAAADDHFS